MNGIWSPPEVGPSSPLVSARTRYSTPESESRRYYGTGSEDNSPPGFRPVLQGNDRAVAAGGTGSVAGHRGSRTPWTTSAGMDSMCRERDVALQRRRSSPPASRPSTLPRGASLAPGSLFRENETASRMPIGPSHPPERASIPPWKASDPLRRLYRTPPMVSTPGGRASPQFRRPSPPDRSLSPQVPRGTPPPRPPSQRQRMHSPQPRRTPVPRFRPRYFADANHQLQCITCVEGIPMGEGRRVFLKRLRHLAYDRLDLVKDFRCQKHDAIHNIHKVLRKEFGPEFSLSYVDEQMATVLRNRRCYLLHKCISKPRSVPMETWYALLDHSQSDEFQEMSGRNREARRTHPPETYLHHCGQGGVLAYASKYFSKHEEMPSAEQVAEYKTAQKAQYRARRSRQEM
jgi:hypothetical protein